MPRDYDGNGSRIYVKISNAETQFLYMLRKQLADYPNVKHDDCLDAVYWALRGMPDVLAVPSSGNELPRANKKKQESPFPNLAYV